jgi:hypothetical protein
MKSNSTCLERFKAYGSYIGLHMALFGQGATLTSFVLPLEFIQGLKAMQMPPHYLHAMDPEAAAKLTPWFAMHPTDPMPTIQNANHELVQFLINDLDVQVSCDVSQAFMRWCSLLCIRYP